MPGGLDRPLCPGETERGPEKGHTPKNCHKVSVQPSPSTKMVDGAAHTSGERGLPFLLAPEQSKAKREREREHICATY